MRPSRYDDVKFHFLGEGEDTDLPGTVIVREGEMVLNIPGGYGPYLIVGKAHQHWFEGANSAHGRQNEVTAKWADMGVICVGQWLEDGNEYLFSFELRPGPADKGA